jgi:hypothetical protein
MCTDEFWKEVERDPDLYLRKGRGEVSFLQYFHTVKNNGIYLVYVRISDDSDISSYQIDLEIVDKNGKFLVNYVGYNA